MFDIFMDLVERNRQRDHEERMAKKDRRKRALGYALFGATVALGLTSRNRLKIEIKDN